MVQWRLLSLLEEIVWRKLNTIFMNHVVPYDDYYGGALSSVKKARISTGKNCLLVTRLI